MTAEIVSVGTELLMGQIADTNAQMLGRMLPELGITHQCRQTVGDNLGRLTEALTLALRRSDIVFTIGGLGPTEDDLTRDGIAAALGVELVHDPEIEAGIRKIFEDRRLSWTDSQRRQAMRPECAEVLDNPNGTAPGLFCRHEGKIVVAMPGPKGEFGPMVALVREKLGQGDTVIHSRILRVAGLGESSIEDRIRAELGSSNPSVAPYAKPGEVHLRLTARAASTEEADAMLDPLEARIRGKLGDSVFGVDDQTLESVVLAMLRQTGQTLAVAESCTGGGLGARITSVEGASDVFAGGVISYSNHAKAVLLDVPFDVLEGPGAVSEACARAMAAGARAALGTDWAVSITGIAGPGGGSDAKPVGTVWIGIEGPDHGKAHGFKFRGTREDIRGRSTQMALTLLRRALL